jgi:hypothetical protein
MSPRSRLRVAAEISDEPPNQISQSAEFKAFSKPPNAFRRQSPVSLVALERCEMVVCLTGAAFGFIGVAFGFDLGIAATATFFGLASCRWRMIGLGGFEEPILTPSDGAMLSSTEAGCTGGSPLAAATSSRSAFANTPCELETPVVVPAGGWTIATALNCAVLSSIADSTPTPNGMRRLNNTILSMMPPT